MEAGQRNDAMHHRKSHADPVEKRPPCQAFYLVDVLGKLGQILSGLPLVELAMAHLQHRRRHITPDLIVHLSYDMLAQNVLYRHKHLHQNHTKQIQQGPEQKSPKIPSYQLLQGFHEGQTPV